MIVFSLVCGLLIAVSLALILSPLRHPNRIAAAEGLTDANVAVYRHQLAEIESDLCQRLMTDEQFLRDRDELEQRLVSDLPRDPCARAAAPRAPDSGVFIYVLAIALPLTAALLYLQLGTPSSLVTIPHP